jgi:hypothetical protein
MKVVSFYTEGSPYDNCSDLSEAKNIMIDSTQGHIDGDIIFYTPRILKEMNYNYHVKEYPNLGLAHLNPGSNNMGFFAWKPLIILLELNKMNDGENIYIKENEDVLNIHN